MAYDYTAAFERLRAAWGGRCVRCGRPNRRVRVGRGFKPFLEFAHLRPIGCEGMGRGMPQRYHSVKNNPGSYVLLCWPCHRAFDRGVALGLSPYDDGPGPAPRFRAGDPLMWVRADGLLFGAVLFDAEPGATVLVRLQQRDGGIKRLSPEVARVGAVTVAELVRAGDIKQKA